MAEGSVWRIRHGNQQALRILDRRYSCWNQRLLVVADTLSGDVSSERPKAVSSCANWNPNCDGAVTATSNRRGRLAKPQLDLGTENKVIGHIVDSVVGLGVSQLILKYHVICDVINLSMEHLNKYVRGRTPRLTLSLSMFTGIFRVYFGTPLPLARLVCCA